MNAPTSAAPSPGRRASELRLALACAACMLAIPLATKLGWTRGDAFAQRALMVILAAFIVLTANAIPKRLVATTCRTAAPARIQAYLRFSGWTWVLAGFAFGIANAVLPERAASIATFTVLPTAIALVGIGWLRLRAATRREG